MTDYPKNRSKISPHITVKCANDKRSHLANSLYCILKQQAGLKTSKEKKLTKQNEKKKGKVASKEGDNVEERDKNPELETEIDLETKN